MLTTPKMSIASMIFLLFLMKSKLYTLKIALENPVLKVSFCHCFFQIDTRKPKRVRKGG